MFRLFITAPLAGQAKRRALPSAKLSSAPFAWPLPVVVVALMINAFATFANADEGQVIDVKIQNHVFTPSQIKVPANKNTTLHIKNMDGQAEEFDSVDLKIEKVIAANSEGDVHLRHLDKGNYNFIGEYHSDTAKGVVVAE